MEVSSWENHLFLWAIFHGYVSHNQRVNPNKGYVTVLVLHPALGISPWHQKYGAVQHFPWQDCYRTPTELCFRCAEAPCSNDFLQRCERFWTSWRQQIGLFSMGLLCGPHHNTTRSYHICGRWWIFSRLAFLFRRGHEKTMRVIANSGQCL